MDTSTSPLPCLQIATKAVDNCLEPVPLVFGDAQIIEQTKHCKGDPAHAIQGTIFCTATAPPPSTPLHLTSNPNLNSPSLHDESH